MNRSKSCWMRLMRMACLTVAAISASLVGAAPIYDTSSYTLSNVPLFLTTRALPLILLDMSRDHQLYFKAYDDYSDINKDNKADRTYDDHIDYYGYFDSKKCYVYNNSVSGNERFEPSSVITSTTDHYCDNSGTANKWSGNFLNWATMTRIDEVRKILYGGRRSTDTGSDTTLERSYLPNDAHSFAKYYNGTDLSNLTPFKVTAGDTDKQATGITICNTTISSSVPKALSQDVNDPPLMRVAFGNFALWAANERWQCKWYEELTSADLSAGKGINGNSSSITGMYAGSNSPTKSTSGLQLGSTTGPDYNVRVQACVGSQSDTTLVGTENCKRYPKGNLKPVGVLQDFGDTSQILFGLMTGSYQKNESGGVLRRQIGNISNEVNVNTDGTFVTSPLTDGYIIQTLDKLRIYGYRHEDGTYFGVSGSDNCTWGLSSFSDGSCTNWGNPQSEMYLEGLRYFAGKSPTSAFKASDPLRLTSQTTWTAPISSNNYCASASIIQFNASTSSYDSDQLSGASDLGISDLNALTDAVGTFEGITGNQYFIGETATDTNQLCTAKTINNLSKAKGTCPDAPRLGGSYQIAGLARYARTNSLIPSSLIPVGADPTVAAAAGKIKTFGVALSPAVPRVTVAVPGATTKKITIQPACRNTSLSPAGNCAIVDFKIVSQSWTDTANSGVLYVNWEDSEQGGDFDQDMWGTIRYTITASTVSITTDVVAKSTPNLMGFGYTLSGTTSDGFFVHSGINGFKYTSSVTAPAGATINYCSNCQVTDSATTNVYVVGTSTAKALEQPLFYASKWGGFVDSNNSQTPDITSEWNKEGGISVDGTPLPDTYFYATNPAELESSLEKAFIAVAKNAGSASAITANTTKLDTGTVAYQASFNAGSWSGQLQAWAFDSTGKLSSTPLWDASAVAWPLDLNHKIASPDARKIFTMVPGDSTAKPLSSADASELALLQASGEATTTNAKKRIEWLRGDQSNEGTLLRARPYDSDSTTNPYHETTLLGDIIDSNPIYSGAQNFHYELLPATKPAPNSTVPTGASSYAAYMATKQARTPAVYVAANDGMLHAFNANTGAELFAYMPSQALKNAIALTRPDYGTPANPHQNFVDGVLYISDAYFDSGDGGGVKWRTILVGSLGGGSKGIFALDVSDPTNFGASNVLWELTDTDQPKLGYMLGRPYIVRMADGRWAAVFGNGYNSTDGHASLFIVNLADKTDTVVIDADTTNSANGLSTPALMVDNTNTVVVAYAGDLQGQLWKFDLSSTDVSSPTSTQKWTVAYQSGVAPATVPQPLFIARGPSGEVQPITAEPTLGYNPKKGNVVMVYFGTGRYVATTDATLPSPVPVQSFYGIADAGPITVTDRSVLVHKTMTTTGYTRTVTEPAMTWSSWSGWYLDLSVSTGERVLSKALLLYDRVLFVTQIPSNAQCTSGLASWLMELSGVGNGSSSYTILGKSGEYFPDGIAQTVSYLGGDTPKIMYSSVKNPALKLQDVPPYPGSGRLSWRQLQ